MKLPLEDMINEQQLLKIALDLLSKDEEHEEASSLLVWYIINNELGDDFSEEEIMKKYTEHLVSQALKNLTDKGLVDYDFESNKYNLTEDGLTIQKMLNEND